MLRVREYPFELQPQYPGMRPNDRAIWEQFILDFPGAFERVWYNVPIGDDYVVQHHGDEARFNGMEGVGCWRIDVVGEWAGNLYVVELKPNAGPGAIGQAIIYSKMFVHQYKPDLTVWPEVITDDLAPITQKAATMCGVIIVGTNEKKSVGSPIR